MIKKNYSCLPYEIYGKTYGQSSLKLIAKDYLEFFLAVGCGAIIFAGFSCFLYTSCMYYFHGITLF